MYLGLYQTTTNPNFRVCFVTGLSDNCSLHVYDYCYYFFFKNSGTQLIKKAVPTPLKTLSQTTNAVTSTVQSPAVIQVGGKIHCTMKEVIERTEENIDVFLLFLTLIWFSLS